MNYKCLIKMTFMAIKVGIISGYYKSILPLDMYW